MAERTGHHRKIHLDNLTNRQREVLELVARGKTNIEIADELGIGFESAKSHVSDILLRLDVSSREDAAAAWRANNSALSRLRRTATGFFVTGFGKAATAGVVALLAVGVGAALFLGGEGDPGSNDAAEALPALETYLIDDGREVNQALAEAEERYGFRLVAPTGDEYRLTDYAYEPSSDVVASRFQSVRTNIRAANGAGYSIQQMNAEIEVQAGDELESGRPDIRIFREVRANGAVYTGIGRGRSFLVSAVSVEQDDQNRVIAILLSMFDADPLPLPPSTVVSNIPNPRATPTPVTEPPQIIDDRTGGTDFVFEGADADETLQQASAAAGFEVALPASLPGTTRLFKIRIPTVIADPQLRSAYISLVDESRETSYVLSEHSRELVEPSAGWGEPIETTRDDISAWRIGDIRNPEVAERAMLLMAVGNGRTVSILVFLKAMTEDEAMQVLISTLDAVP